MDVIFPRFEPFKTKLIFYRIPKNASTSIYKQLGKKNVINLYYDEIAKRADQRIYKNIFDTSHLKPEELRSFNILNVDDFFSFCVVRNPWDRVVSMYEFSILNKDLFKKAYSINKEDFISFCNVIKDRKNDPFFIGSHKQSEWIDKKTPPNKILFFESLQEDFSSMIKEINLIGVTPKLPHQNKTKHNHYSQYYNSETKQIISEVFEEDIDNFRYIFKQEDSNEDKTIEGKLKI